MDTRELLAVYQSQADELLARAEALELQAHDLRIRRDALLGAADLLRPLANDDPEDLSDVLVDFDRCANNVERIIRIARAAPHKLLNVTKVAHYLESHEQSNGKFETLRAEVGRAFIKHPELFERVSRGVYRYKGDSQGEVGAAVVVASHEPVDAPADWDAGS